MLVLGASPKASRQPARKMKKDLGCGNKVRWNFSQVAESDVMSQGWKKRAGVMC